MIACACLLRVRDRPGELSKQKIPFQPVVAIAFNKSASASSGSKYSKVLLLAQSTGISAADFPKWLEQEAGLPTPTPAR